MLPWDERAIAVVERRRQLIAASEESGDLESIRALDDRYLRSRVEQRGRTTLPTLALVHLAGEMSVHVVYVLRFPEEIEIWSTKYRNELVRESVDAAEFAGLP
jgi:hypothetical protein